MQVDRTKRRRHVYTSHSHIYKSQRANGTWVYEVRRPPNAAGKRLFEVVGPRLDQAKAKAREVHGDSTPHIVSVNVTLNDVVEDWRRTRQMRPRTEQSFDANLRLHILPRFGRTKVRDIGKQEILAWLAGLKRKDGQDGELASGTQGLLLATLRVVLTHAVEMGALGANPVSSIERRRRPKKSESRQRVVTPDEETRLLAYSAPYPWLAPIITVTLHQALRLGEVLGLQWADIDFAAGKLHVRHSLGRDRVLGPPKGGKALSIPLTPVARQALLELRQDSDGTGFVFRTRTGSPRRHRDLQRAFDKARKRAALQVTNDGPVVFHSLRHTGISRLANHPAIPLVHVRDFARHTDLAVTQGYVHKIEDEKVNAAIAEALGREVTA